MGIGKGSFIRDLQKMSEKEKKHPIVREDCHLEAFAGQAVPVDVPIYGYVYMYTARKRAIGHTDVVHQELDHGVLRSYWLEQYFELMIAFIESKVAPVACFDGKPFPLKNNTAGDRKAKFAKEEEEIAELRAQLQAKPDKKLEGKLRNKLASHVVFEPEDWIALEDMFNTMGLPVIHEDFEAEAVAARLCWRGYSCAVATNDSDVLTHGVPIMIRKIKRRYVRGEPDHRCECIVRDDVLALLDMNDVEFVEFCMLVETDYNKRIKGYGFGKGLKLYRKYGSWKAVIEFLSAKKNLSEYRLSDSDMRAEIFGYFTNELDFELDGPLVVHYQQGLISCFDEIFEGIIKQRMISQCGRVAKTLKSFNQLFASLQKFVFVHKEVSDVVIRRTDIAAGRSEC